MVDAISASQKNSSVELIRATLFAALALSICSLSAACFKVPHKYGNDKALVEGRIVDTEGRPVGGVVIHAAHIRAVGGSFHNSPRWSDVLHHDRFITDADGRYSGHLDFLDDAREKFGPEYIFYYACRDGYQPALLYFPQRETVVVRRIEEPPAHSVNLVFGEVFQAAGCQ
jgi:hypothetical protein